MTYEKFTVYPIEIQGITAVSDQKIEAIEKKVIEKIGYSGQFSDIENLTPYLVYFHFLEDLLTDVSARTGETAIVRDDSNFSTRKMVAAWNEGAFGIMAIAKENGETYNTAYLSPREEI